MNVALNRTQVVYLTNKSGSHQAQGSTVILDPSNPSAFTTTTTNGYVDGMVGVVTDPAGIADESIGAVALAGYVPRINLSASAALGDLFKTHTVAGQAAPHSAPMVSGDFGMVLGTGTSPAAILYPVPIQPQTSSAAYYSPTGLTGATSASRYVGATASGAPVSGTFAVGDFVIDRTGAIWICQVAGTPGTWFSPGSGSGRTLISEQTPSGVSSVTWSGISGSYKKLILEWVVRSSSAIDHTQLEIKVNADGTASNYLASSMFSYNAAVGAGATSSQDISYVNADNNPGGEFTQGITEILQYASTNFRKQILTRSGGNRGATVYELGLVSTVDWLDTSAISQIDISLASGDFMVGSVLRLYGEN